MRKNTIITAVVLSFLSIITFTPAYAALTQIPGKISAPVILYDEGGNTLATGDYGILVSLKDELNNALYTEEHVVRVKDGVAQIILGEGFEPGSEGQKPTGGLVLDDFITSGVVNVEILVEGQFSPQEIATLGSQPYSYVSQQSLSVVADAIISASIKDGSITSSDVSADFTKAIIDAVLLQIPAVTPGPTTNDIVNSLSATKIAVSADIGLKNASGLNIESILKGLDQAIETLREIHLKQGLANLDTKLTAAIAQEVTDRTADVDAEEAARIADVDAEETVRMAVDTNLQNQLNDHTGTAINGAHAGQLPTTRLSGQITNGQIEDNAITSAKISNGTVISDDISDGTIASSDISNGTILSEDIADGAIVSSDISNGSILLEDLSFNFNGWDTSASDDFTQAQADARYSALGHSHTPADVGAAPSSHDHDGSYVNVTGDVMSGPLDMGGNNITNVGTINGVSVTNMMGTVGSKTASLNWVTNQDNSSGGRVTGADSGNWSLSNVNTGDGKWVSIQRSVITVPAGCIPMAQGSVSPDVSDGTSSNLDWDDLAYMKITHSGTTVNYRVYSMGNDGDYDINIHVIAIPTSSGTDCTIP